MPPGSVCIECGLLRTFGDSGELKHNRHERVEGGARGNPCEAMMA
jgi:hypothetical protein